MSREPFFLHPNVCAESCSRPYGCDCCKTSPCQIPQACEQPEPESLTTGERFTFWFLPVVAVLAAVALGVYHFFY